MERVQGGGEDSKDVPSPIQELPGKVKKRKKLSQWFKTTRLYV